VQLLSKFAFFNFSKRYFGTHETKLAPNWTPDQNILNEFHAFLLKEGFQFSEGDFAQNNDWIKRFLRKEMYITAFSADEARRITVETDPMVEKAVDSLPKAKALLETAKRVIVQRLSK
jgi:carboxyl-terminal processing protease